MVSYSVRRTELFIKSPLLRSLIPRWLYVMLARLASHPAFAGEAAERLKMCGDCRVVDMMEKDAGAASGTAVR